jgi:hypothetical protein
MKNGNHFTGNNNGNAIANENCTVYIEDKNSNAVPYEELCKAVRIKKTDQFFKREWITIAAEVLTIITGMAAIFNFNFKIEWKIVILIFLFYLFLWARSQYRMLDQIKSKKSFNFDETAIIERQGYIYSIYPKKCPKCGEKAGGMLKFVRQTDDKWILQCNVQPQHTFEYDHTEVVFKVDDNS